MCVYATGGGKRVRSLLIKYLTPNKSYEEIKHSILFIEYLHASSLVIDDIMDKDTMRRNKESFYIKYGIASGLNCGVYRRFPARDRFGSFILAKFAHKFRAT